MIVDEFGYDIAKDMEAAMLLDSLLEHPFDTKSLDNMIRGRAVLCMGAGPSLERALEYTDNTVKIAADSAVPRLLHHGITPDIVVTDLDGLDITIPYEMPVVVHAHGDNRDRLHHTTRFPYCVGSTQGKPVGKVYNFGGFTDGDRAVFLADYFGAEKIILCGMDLGGPVVSYSTDPITKMKKLRVAARLLEWLATYAKAELYVTSFPLRGFGIVEPKDIPGMIP